MADLSRRPAGLKGAELGQHRARIFVGNHCILGSTLVVPLWLVWLEYEAFAKREGFEPHAADLRKLFDDAPWAKVIERPHARGRLKTIVEGVGIRPRDKT